MFKRFGVKALSLVTAIAVTVFSLGSVASATASHASTPVSGESLLADPNFVQAERVLAAIERMPDSVINSGPDAIIEWLNTNTEFRISEFETSGAIGCISAVGLALIGLIAAPAKLLKIKEAIKVGGGTVKFVNKVLETYKVAKGMGIGTMEAIKMGVQDAAKTAGKEVVDALIGIFGVGAVYSSCFE
ncbi:hypothetical protein LQV63_16520 [Paenibacillus profundus]|uniref:Uncharacterized protein n=1 Tax=Paenibacillus profundus TaxID=1173085 RepID=A0ABS8YKM4_9BACL|nr:hypothetical protein [Paenibacillus profundus]MCE5170910.1 hypothetical protein [Paenibacillus profundus]